VARARSRQSQMDSWRLPTRARQRGRAVRAPGRDLPNQMA
jgi:hypothetical protein